MLKAGRSGKRKKTAVCMTALGLSGALLWGMPQKSYAENAAFDICPATLSDAKRLPAVSALTDDIWSGWIGDISFLSGRYEDGSKEKPYQIATKAQLMGLSELASMGMKINENEGTYPGDYRGAYFKLTKDIDLGGRSWIPIGFYRNTSEIGNQKLSGFEGHFDGNGKTISNFRLYHPDWNYVGLFGAIKNSEIKDLTVKPGYVITAGENAGILAGSAEHSVIRGVRTMGALKTMGNTGGLLGEISENTVVENCLADHIAMDAGEAKEIFIGGITGKASESLIADCTVNTGDSRNARICGGGYVGGITGFQNGTDIFNVRVSGTIGGAGSQAIGGVTGKYASGKMKVVRFEGRIANSGLGYDAREGTFIGTHDTGFHFRYGAEEQADLAYLFADKEEKIRAGICGSGIREDNLFPYGAHIGFWHTGDNHFTLIQGDGEQKEEQKYFYEELEDGILHLTDTEASVRSDQFFPDHFAPGPSGRPVAGHLVSVLQIDTAANVEQYYDVAILTARGESVYSKEMDKSHRGAVAAGDLVTVVTAPKNTEEAKYQMEGTPTYTDKSGRKRSMAYQTGGSYSFVMPDCDTEIAAVYKKVAANACVTPEEICFRVVQERSGDRKNPSVVTEVKNASGKLIARYINGKLETDTQVQEVKVKAVVDKNNDVADSRVRWSVDDKGLLLLKHNDDEDAEGYTDKSASVELNLQSDFFQDIIRKAEKEQIEKNYRYPIADTVYGNGVGGGVAVLTAETRPAASFEGKSLTANCRIAVTFQIKDRTRVSADEVCLDKNDIRFTVTRTLSGDRKAPKESISVSGPITLSASFGPEYFDKKDISWSVSDNSILKLEGEDFGKEDSSKDYRNVSVYAKKDSRWIRDIMEADDARCQTDPYARRKGSGQKTAEILLQAEDILGNKKTAVCKAEVQFITKDQTEVRAESIETDKDQLEFDMILTKMGRSSKPDMKWSGAEAQILNARVLPERTKERETEDIWPQISWSADPAVLIVDDNGRVQPQTDSAWIRDAMKSYPYTAEKRTILTAAAGDKRKEIPVTLKFKLVNHIRTSSGGGSSHGSGGSSGGSSGKKYSSGITTEGTVKTSVSAPENSLTGIWVKDGAERWLFINNGRTFAKEWGYIHNPYAQAGQEAASWFYFMEDGTMATGWYQDPSNKNWYYLHDKKDGSRGYMYTGWHQINGSWYYFEKNGRMLAGTTTPDGFYVDASGAWIENKKAEPEV